MSIIGFGCSNVLCVSQSVSFPSSHKGYYSANGIPGSKADNECNRNLEFHFASSHHSKKDTRNVRQQHAHKASTPHNGTVIVSEEPTGLSAP
jgi:hypothetical protein